MSKLDFVKKLFCVYLLMPTPYIVSDEHCCRTDITSMKCSGCIPIDVQQNISEVSIFAIEFANYASRRNFQGKNWNNVKQLVIIPEENSNGSQLMDKYKRFTLRSKSFVNLKSLVSLRFSSERLTNVENAVFKYIPKLEILDLSNCLDINLQDITRGIEGSNLLNLRVLILRSTSQLSTKISHFGERFFSALSSSRLEHIDLSYTRDSIMDARGFSHAFPYLQSLNVEHGGYLALNFLQACYHYGSGSTFAFLRRININFPIIPEAVISANNDDLLFESSFIHNFTEIHARSCTPVNSGFSTEIHGKRLKSSVRVSLNIIGTGVTWQAFHLLINDDGAIALETFDVSENGIEYIDTSMTSLGKHLKHIDVSVNRLFKMNEASLETVLHDVTELQIFNCSHNGIKRIPKDTFKYSVGLKVLDLSFNLIQSLNFEIYHLLDLELLDISGNKFHFLSLDVINRFKLFLSGNININLRINITGNPFKCTCQTRDFVTWFGSRDNDSVFYNKEGFMCNIDENRKIPLNQNAVSEVEYLCVLPYIIAAASVGSALCAFAVLAIGVCCYRRYKEMRRKQKLRRCIENYKLERKKKFPVFLSYSSSDAGIVESHVLTTLNVQLQRLLETEERCIVTGDLCFTPGFYVAEEIVTCIESCNVLLACVSKSYCQSVFCKDELLAAKHDNIPMILLFLEEVDIKDLPKSIQTHFKTITRTKLTINDIDLPVFTPCIETICEGIIRLMEIKKEPEKQGDCETEERL